LRWRRLPGMPVLALDSGAVIGKVRQAVIDPEERKVAALLVQPARSWVRQFLPMEAVRALGGHAVTVESREALIPVRQDERLWTLLVKKRIALAGSPVITAGGDLVGGVRDYEIGQGGAITRLYVGEGGWRFLTGSEREIPAASLLALGRDAVIVTEEALDAPRQERSPGDGGD